MNEAPSVRVGSATKDWVLVLGGLSDADSVLNTLADCVREALPEIVADDELD